MHCYLRWTYSPNTIATFVFFLIYFRSDGLWFKTNSQTLKNYISIRINVSFIQGINSTSENVTSAGMSAEIQFPLNF